MNFVQIKEDFNNKKILLSQSPLTLCEGGTSVKVLGKKILLIILTLVIAVVFLGNLGEANNNLVWKEFSNKYFKIAYPAEWNKVAAGNRVGFAAVNSSEYFGFDINVIDTEDLFSLKDFQHRIDREIKKLHSEASSIEVENIFIDSHPGYKVIVTNSSYQIKGVIISIFKDQIAIDLIYTGNEDEYLENMEIMNTMINSLRLFDVDKEEKIVDLVKDRNLTVKEALKDAKFLFEKLEELHPNLYKYYTKREANEYFHQIEREVMQKNELTKLELYRLLAPYVAKFNDGHTALSIVKEYNNYLELGGEILPIKVVAKGDQLFTRELYTENNIPKGTEVLSINGLTSLEILETMKKGVSSDLEGDRLGRVEDDFPMLLWANYGQQNFFVVKFKMKSGEVKSIFIKAIESKADRDKKQHDYYLSYPDEKVALLKINNFNVENGMKFKTFVESSFEEIKHKKCENLIIDIRNNGGGTTALVNNLYGYITDKPYRDVREIRYKLSDYVLEHGSYLKLSRVAKLGNTRIMVEERELKKPDENSDKFKGNIYVLIGDNTYSAAVSFAAMVKDFDTGLLVGEETGGYASHTGNSVNLKLPYSGLTLRVATMYSIRPAGYDDGRGVVPDVEVDVDPLKLLQGEDQVLETVLEIIKNR